MPITAFGVHLDLVLPGTFSRHDAAVIMEDVLGFDLTSFHNIAKETNREQYENILRGFGEDNVYAPDSEAAVNYVLGLFALMKKMSRPTFSLAKASCVEGS